MSILGIVDVSYSENLPVGIRSSRRHLMQIGAIAGAALLAHLSKIEPAAANCGHNGKDVGEGCEVACFLRGTTIRTADGDSKVEDLAVGDLLPTAFTEMRPIQWIGRYSFKRGDLAKGWPRDVLPVRVSKSALAPDIPNADLYVTKPHALLIDGVLVPAGNLINGTTITIYDARELDKLEFFHIKLELHDVIYAEGVPCETLVGVDENAVNFAEYLRQYGPPMIEDARCAPWVGFGPRVEIKSHFRSAISPLIDRRQKLDIIRDRLEERGIALFQQSETV